MLFESHSEENFVNCQNSIHPTSIDDIQISTGVISADYKRIASVINPSAPPYDAVGNLLSTHMNWALKYQQFNFDKYTENEITMQIPLPMFCADEPFFVGARKRL